jgi:heterodisulfide reductase subunit B
VGEQLGMIFDEIEDWNCCGATEYVTVKALPAYSLVARNLSLAAKQATRELVAPCSACYLNLRRTNDTMAKYPEIGKKVNQALSAGGLDYAPDTLRIRHLLDAILEDVGLEEISNRVKTPLKGLRIAPYYGCLVVRPTRTGADPEYPMTLDHLMETLGATVVDFPLKAHCCGGHMTQISEATAFELLRRILQNAADYKADAIVTLCPMCQLNLDAYQANVNRMFGTSFNIPVLFFTQLMGLAFGLGEEEVGIGSEITPAGMMLKKIGREEAEAPRQPQRRDKNALPMPPR